MQGNDLNFVVQDGDIEELAREGLISMRGEAFSIPVRSIAAYQQWKESNTEPSADVELQISRYLD